MEQVAKIDLKINFCRNRALRYGAFLLCVVVLLVLGHVPLLRTMGWFLIVEDPLRPAAAIVVLGGQSPFREMEAARLYAEGWAPKVMLVPGALWDEQQMLLKLRIRVPEDWEISREVLLKRGVPSSAIIIAAGRAEGTLEELKLAHHAIGPVNAPVILVSSKFHTRRVRLTWNYITHGRSSAIVRAAEGDPFDPARWWTVRRFALSVVREYLGILHVYAGFPVAPRISNQTSFGPQAGDSMRVAVKRQAKTNSEQVGDQRWLSTIHLPRQGDIFT
jgi:hypothetical protein